MPRVTIYPSFIVSQIAQLVHIESMAYVLALLPSLVTTGEFNVSAVITRELPSSGGS